MPSCYQEQSSCISRKMTLQLGRPRLCSAFKYLVLQLWREYFRDGFAEHCRLISPFVSGMIFLWKQVVCAMVKPMVVFGSVMMQWKILGSASFAVHKNQPLVPMASFRCLWPELYEWSYCMNDDRKVIHWHFVINCVLCYRFSCRTLLHLCVEKFPNNPVLFWEHWSCLMSMLKMS